MTEPELELLEVRPMPVVQRVATSDERDEAVRRAVLALYDAHHREIATFARAIERDPQVAEDVVSETFVRLVEAVRSGRTPEQPRAWLHRVAANLVVDHGRRRQVFQRFAGRLLDRGTAEPADARILGAESQRELLDALASLPADARVALMLAAHGFTGREVAEALGRSELATRSLMWRARTSLRERLGAREGLR